MAKKEKKQSEPEVGEAKETKKEKLVTIFDANEKPLKVPAGYVEEYLAMGYRKGLPKKPAVE